MRFSAYSRDLSNDRRLAATTGLSPHDLSPEGQRTRAYPIPEAPQAYTLLNRARKKGKMDA